MVNIAVSSQQNMIFNIVVISWSLAAVHSNTIYDPIEHTHAFVYMYAGLV